MDVFLGACALIAALVAADAIVKRSRSKRSASGS